MKWYTDYAKRRKLDENSYQSVTVGVESYGKYGVSVQRISSLGKSKKSDVSFVKIEKGKEKA